MAQVLTANRLNDGEVVYLARDGAWVERIELAQIMTSKAEGEASLTVGTQAESDLKIVHAYLFDVLINGANVKPVKMREVIRAAGPTVRRDLGKQAAS